MKTIQIVFSLLLFTLVTEAQNNRHYNGPRTSPVKNNNRFYDNQRQGQTFCVDGPRVYVRQYPPRRNIIVPIIPIVRVSRVTWTSRDHYHYHWIPIYEILPNGQEIYVGDEQRECHRRH